jgi:hypothetical protein
MNPDDFEKRLQRQPLRQVPSEWRESILRGATHSRHPSPATRHSLLSTLNHQLSTIFWPNPKAWAGLAAVWVVIFALHLADREHSPMMATIPAPSTPETMATLKDQQKILAELLGNNEPREVEQPRRFPATPHSERRRSISMV